MDERRQADFTDALNSIKGLVTYAMDEIERAMGDRSYGGHVVSSRISTPVAAT